MMSLPRICTSDISSYRFDPVKHVCVSTDMLPQTLHCPSLLNTLWLVNYEINVQILSLIPDSVSLSLHTSGKGAQHKAASRRVEAFPPAFPKAEKWGKNVEPREDNKENWSELDVPEVQEEAKQRSVFERAVYDLKHSERVMDELTFGRRVALYELRGEIGSGNFSQVRLGIHDLTNGETSSDTHYVSAVNLSNHLLLNST